MYNEKMEKCSSSIEVERANSQIENFVSSANYSLNTLYSHVESFNNLLLKLRGSYPSPVEEKGKAVESLRPDCLMNDLQDVGNKIKGLETTLGYLVVDLSNFI